MSLLGNMGWDNPISIFLIIFIVLDLIYIVWKGFTKLSKKDDVNIELEEETKIPSWLVPLLGPFIAIFGLNEFFKITKDMKPKNFREDYLYEESTKLIDDNSTKEPEINLDEKSEFDI